MMGNRFRGLSVAIGMVLFTLPSIAMGETRWFHVDDPENYTLRLEPRVWFATESTFDGSFDFDTGIGAQAVAGIDTSLNKETRFNPFVELQLGKSHKLRGAYLKIDQGRTLPGGAFSIELGGTQIDQSLVPDSEATGAIKLDIFEVGYQYDLFEGAWGFLGPLLDVAIVDFNVLGSAKYDSTGNGIADQDDMEEEAGTVPLPQIGIGGRVYPTQRVAVRAEAKGITIGSRGTFIQAFGGLEFQASQHLGISGGYQYLRLDIDIDAVDTTFKNHGPYVGAVLRF